MELRAHDWGVADGYRDSSGNWRRSPPEAVAMVRARLRGDAATPPEGGPMRIVSAGHAAPIQGAFQVITEEGETVEGSGTLPATLPLGYHTLHGEGGTQRLAVTPRRCPVPPHRTWGWALQLYAARSAQSWGIGDLRDLRTLASWSAHQGAGVVLLNPLHAVAPTYPQEASPYFPSSRRFRNPLYLAIDDVPGASAVDTADLATLGRALSRERLIDRDAVYRLKRAALERIWAVGAPAAFHAWLESNPTAVQWGVYCALTEVHGPDWHRWPHALRSRQPEALAAALLEHADRLRFHAWQQWLVERQLSAASALMPTVQDLAIGVDPNGADAWEWQTLLAGEYSLGAPPDEFNTLGQDWGLPPFDPFALRASGYEPFIATVRAGLAHAGGLRFDHVMGLFRLYWVPRGGSAQDGVYVTYPAQDLLDLLALEATRANAFVVGEDLGTVEPHVRTELAERRVLSYRLLWFEAGAPEDYPELAVAAVTTHDLPTVAGLWTGSDLAMQQRLGLSPNVEATLAMRQRLAASAGLVQDAPVEEVVEGAHRLLARAPSLVIAATLDDALAVEERPNVPGTTVAVTPNWSLALPVTLEVLQEERGPRRIAELLGRGRPSPPVS